METEEQLLDRAITCPDPEDPPSTFQEKVYPEHLLHLAPHAAQYYGSLQQLTPQFVEEPKNNIVQFSTSTMERLLREKVNMWNNYSEVHPDQDLASSVSTSAANSLFSWSTSDTSIAARKRLLQERTSMASLNGKDSTAEPRAVLPLPTKTNPVMPRLARIVESESNKFIQDRIEVIKAHHRQEASKKLDERKRKDHEMHLQRVRRKEAQFEQSLKAAIAMENMNRQSGFFGSLFGSKHNSSRFTLDVDTEVQSYPPPVVPVNALPRPKKNLFFPGIFGIKSLALGASSARSTLGQSSFEDTRSMSSNDNSNTNADNVINSPFASLNVLSSDSKTLDAQVLGNKTTESKEETPSSVPLPTAEGTDDLLVL